MSLPRYSKYKDSGVEWLGQVPEHWVVARVKHIAEKIGSGKTPLGGSEIYVPNGVLFLRSQNIYDDGLSLDDAVYIAPEIDCAMKNTRVKAGDILLNVTGASIGRTSLVPTPFVPANVNQHVCIIRISRVEYREFIALVMKADLAKSQISLAQTGAAREGLNFDQIGNLVFAMPPSIEELNTIVGFLDCEIAKIDALVEEQRRLIELLKEKRQAVISHAVAKGAEPGASNSMVNIGQSTVTEMFMPLPSPKDEVAISNFIECASMKLDQLTAEAVHAIELLQERRTALISAAVTGKIGVRGLVEEHFPSNACASQLN